MSEFVGQVEASGTSPVVTTLPTCQGPTQAEPPDQLHRRSTMFHEFGHAATAMFPTPKYPTLAGT